MATHGDIAQKLLFKSNKYELTDLIAIWPDYLSVDLFINSLELGHRNTSYLQNNELNFLQVAPPYSERGIREGHSFFLNKN